jgi:hypothetical protein
MKENPMKRHVRLLALAATMISGFANAQVSVSDAWVRATVPQQKATGAFLKLQAAQDSKLVAATSPLTPVVEVHGMAMQDNVMKMRQVPSIALPAGKTVELKPGGYHVMLMDLKGPLARDSTVPLTLVFKDAKGVESRIELKVPVSTAPVMHKH